MIEVDSVSIQYGTKRVIKNVSFNIPDYGITALVGPNGAGKSTVLSGMGRLLPLEAGEVRLEGTKIQDWKNEELAKKMAILRQANPINMRLTVAELVLLGRFPHSKGHYTQEDYQIVERSLEQVNMTSLSNRFIDEISGGQRQRALVAMTLAQDAKYLLLDEPLAALDMRNSRDMMRHLQKLAKDQGISVVIIIHDINIASAYADRIIAIKNGEIIANGTPNEIINEKVLSNVFDCKVDVGRIGDRLVALPQP